MTDKPYTFWRNVTSVPPTTEEAFSPRGLDEMRRQFREIERQMFLSGRERGRLRRKKLRDGTFVRADRLPGIRHNIASSPSAVMWLR